VLRAHLTETKHCYLHPHRVVKTACARCKTPYCDECLETRDTGLFARIVAKDEKNPPPLFCERCVDEVEALEALEAERKRPLHQRLRPTRDGLRRAAIWAGVIVAVTVPMFFAVRSMAETTVTPEELSRIRDGLFGGFLSPGGVSLLRDTYGGRFIRASAPSQAGHEPARLIDGWAQADIPAWRSANTNLPIDLVFQFQQLTRFNTLVLKPHPSEPLETGVKDFELLVSESPDSGFTRVTSGSMRPGAELRLPVGGEVSTRNVMLRITGTQGSASYASLAELEVLLAPAAS
jgi:hypothetical protein